MSFDCIGQGLSTDLPRNTILMNELFRGSKKVEKHKYRNQNTKVDLNFKYSNISH